MLISSFQNVHRALAKEDTQKLQLLSQLAKQELAKLVAPLNKVIDDSDSERVLRIIEELLQRPVTARTITGVIGETGAGKSSLINALLGEERLLPTNGMRAYTAAVTEIAWNDSDNPDELYRAEIEFIKGAVPKDASNKKTEAGIAMAKIRSVYPDIDDGMLVKKNAEKLAQDKSLRDILGTTLTIKARQCSEAAQTDKAPGCDDANAARGTVAEKYMQKCTSLWIVAPISRAVDNKAAQHLLGHLLGESFKMQLKYDGNYTNITFICSQSDGLAVEEMADSLELSDSLADCEANENSTNAILASKEVDIKNVGASYYSAVAERKNVDKQPTLWCRLETQAIQGKPVYAPSTSGRKRKSNIDQPQPSKGRGKAKEDKRTVHELEEQIYTLQADLEQRKLSLRADSIRRRNDYSRTTIQQDFVHGLKLLDQETAMHDQGYDHNPDKDLRDYEAVANLLPVFCDTEIPQLLAHAKKSTNVGRARNCKKFLNNALQVWQSFQLWASDTTIGVALTEEQMEAETSLPDQDLANLRKASPQSLALKETTANTTSERKSIMKKNLFNKFKTAVNTSAKEARPITQSWVSAKKDNGRSLYVHSTYKAFMRRGGYYKKGDREIDFNEGKTLHRKLATNWELAFSKEIPSVLEQFCHTIQERMHCIKDLQETYCSELLQGQREASRDFTPEIKETMSLAYGKSAKESGAGSFGRMQQIIDDHIVQNDKEMYEKATTRVQKSLYRLCNNYQRDMGGTVDNTVDSMVTDYKNCLLLHTLLVTPEPSEGEDVKTEQKVSSNDSAPQALVVTTSMDIDDSPNADHVATEQPMVKAVDGATNISNPSASVEAPNFKTEEVSPQNEMTDNSQKREDNGSGTVDQIMGGTDT
ncbi:hypothetical protein PG994_010378 [Apiospora phragmitis]|uniref:Dynamin N-terminal domain-containing protein n=1 Tax=Apiospora phragmitis TaxID=2905665 RepID=A0ABR1TSD8_9PEZI